MYQQIICQYLTASSVSSCDRKVKRFFYAKFLLSASVITFSGVVVMPSR